MTEPHEPQEIIEDLARRTGLTEKEARVLYHLDRAADHYYDILETQGPNMSRTMEWRLPHQDLVQQLMARIAERDHPEGWRKRAPREEQREAGGAGEQST
jgi:hypothetical protein